MCWGELPRHPGRAHAWPLCGPWPRPHLAAAKLVELRSSVNLVAMPHQPLDRPVASLTNPGLRDVRCAHIAPPWAVLGSPPARRLQMKLHHPSSASVALEEGGPKKAQYEERSDDVLGEIAQTPRPSTRLASLRPVAEAASGRRETR
jgi:hypothetical protein